MSRLWNRYRYTSALPFSLCFLPALVFGVVVNAWPWTVPDGATAPPRDLGSGIIEPLYKAGLQKLGLWRAAPLQLALVREAVPEAHPERSPTSEESVRVTPSAPAVARDEGKEGPSTPPGVLASPTQVAILNAIISEFFALKAGGQSDRAGAICRKLLPTDEALRSVLVPTADALVYELCEQHFRQLRQVPLAELSRLLPVAPGEHSPDASATTVPALAAIYPAWDLAAALRRDTPLATVRLALPADASLHATPTVFAVFFWSDGQWYYLDLELLPWPMLKGK